MVDRFNSRVKRLNSLEGVGACCALGNVLRRMRGPVAELYRTGVVQPGKPPAGTKKPAERAGVDGALSGTVSELTARSACAADEFWEAVELSKPVFLAGITGKGIVWRAMLLEPAKASDGRVTARVMAGRAKIAAEFPPASEAARLTPGASLLLAGELRQAAGAWLVHVDAWGLCSGLDRGEPMTPCKWPEAPAEGPAEP